MNELILCTTDDGRSQVKLRADQLTVWLTQLDMAELFDATKQSVSLHLRKLFQDGELDPAAVVKNSLTTAADGMNYRQVSMLYTLCRESPSPSPSPIRMLDGQGIHDCSNTKAMAGRPWPARQFAARRVANFFGEFLAANTDESSMTQGGQRGKS